ncbi:bifunctional glutamate N-acetyltransferase/amino-acid acetyltransferase ArgJ, partial [bacterium]|nr:bifunctional glutamate N-acetyltransferase/amino-acid acetyltransferase ArgJ [bacterium]
MKIIKGGITAPRGFKAAGTCCGIKSSKKDLALIFSDKPAVTAGLFTTNQIKSAHVLLDLVRLRKKESQAIITNSGNANACNGAAGRDNALEMSEYTAKCLNIDGQGVLVASTGIIGKPLPMNEIKKGIKDISDKLAVDGSKDAAEAILTTDSAVKEIAVDTGIKGRTKDDIKIGAIAKGSGMIAPNMATLLAFITTDACIEYEELFTALRECVNTTFNMLTVDGDMSPNDTVIIMANGLARNKRIKFNTPEYEKFTCALNHVCAYLTKKIAADGEGATKLVEVQIKVARNIKDARRAAKAVANSNLVKTALNGCDPNWGRILSSLGAARIKIKPGKIDAAINSEPIVHNSISTNFSPE